MKTIRRYLSYEIIAATGLVMLAFLALFGFFDLVEELDKVGKAGYRLKHALIFVVLSLPSRAYEIFPITTLIGTLFALTSLARNSEITAMRTAGLSTRKAVILIAQIGLMFAATTFVLGEFIAPPLERVAQKWRLRSTNSTLPQELRSGFWVRDGRLFVNAERVQPDKGLEGVRIYEFDEHSKLVSLSDAVRGEYKAGQGWLLSDVTRTSFLPDRTQLERLPQLQWKSELTPELVSVVMVTPERMALRTLVPYVQHLKDNNQKTGRHEVALWKKLVFPFASIVMMCLALPFAFIHHRSGAVGAKVLLGVAIGMTFHLLNGLFTNLGIINAWPAAVSAVAPSALFMVATAAMLWWVERR
ncbi:LPS export ABC transporter permease LptG [Niveibacterium umoris]|uniref:Lipopolysaccharide export system permease protein n=1 Tax=Niveibacterium umoris TaxID=1193620 RepID=A0A840BHH7_9RHOO|nr:LPS export ABC transporter permease LptG [Niveibacterium umoris]MBB4012420.1 lipopolysaccharide export system permease protein [Niveibacterium umoris]